MSEDTLKHIVELIQAGRLTEAQAILHPMLKADPCNGMTWILYSETCPVLEQRILALETGLRYNPSDVRIQSRLEDMRVRQKEAVAAIPLPGQFYSVDPLARSLRQEIAGQTAAPADKTNPASHPENGKPVPPAFVEQPASNGGGDAAQTAGREESEPGGTTGFLIAVGILCVAIFAMLIYFVSNNRPLNPADYRHEVPVEYYLYVPTGYDKAQAWPLFVGIHGTGGSGRDCWNLWQQYAEREGYILLCPTLSDSSGGWYQKDGEAKVIAAINQVVLNYHLKPRIFLTGFSAGAQFVQGFTFDNPQSVAGVAVLSSGNYYVPSTVASGIPFLVVIGDQDDAGAVSGSRQFANSVAKIGASVDYEVLPGVGHQVVDKTRELVIDFFEEVEGK